MQQTEQQRLILEAMSAANPDIEGDLMRELTKRGVAGPVKELQDYLCQNRKASRDRRPRYVSGWRPNGEKTTMGSS